MYYRASYYQPSLGRFTQPDSIIPEPGNTQDWNRYMYVRGNPVRYDDPTGHYQRNPMISEGGGVSTPSCAPGPSGAQCRDDHMLVKHQKHQSQRRLELWDRDEIPTELIRRALDTGENQSVSLYGGWWEFSVTHSAVGDIPLLVIRASVMHTLDEENLEAGIRMGRGGTVYLEFANDALGVREGYEMRGTHNFQYSSSEAKADLAVVSVAASWGAARGDPAGPIGRGLGAFLGGAGAVVYSLFDDIFGYFETVTRVDEIDPFWPRG